MARRQESEPAPQSAVVVGAGIAGLFSALFLSRAGMQVTVVDANADVAQSGGSFLNGGCLCPSLTLPWQHPSSLAHAARSVAARDGAVAVTWAAVADWRFLRWGAQLLAASADWRASHRASYELSVYSLRCMGEVVRADAYRGGASGSLQLFASAADRDRRQALIAPVVPGLRALSAREAMRVEPALAASPRLGLFSSSDSSGDIRLCALAVKRLCLLQGVQFLSGRSVARLEAEPDSEPDSEPSSDVFRRRGRVVRGARLDDGALLCADTFVVAAGINSEDFMEAAGDGRAAWPVHGYVLEVPVSAESADCEHPLLGVNVVDDVAKVYASPVRAFTAAAAAAAAPTAAAAAAAARPASVRLSGVCELRGASDQGEADEGAATLAFASLLGAAREFFPPAYLVTDSNAGIVRHKCVRPQTPDDLPVIGPSPTHRNLFYCSGHGHLGWTRAAGSARLLADLVTGAEPELDAEPFSPLRFAPFHTRALAWVRARLPPPN